MQLVLSLCSGIGLLDRAFKEAGFCVVSAGDIILGKHYDIRDFTGIKGKIDGIIGGPPCPDFSPLKRDRPVLEESYGFEMLMEYKRIVLECDPSWFLLENVAGVPNVKIDGYSHQRLDINQSWYENVTRLRHIQFGHKENKYLQIERKNVTDRSQKLESCALANDSRSFRELCRLQGLEDDFDLKSFNVQGKKRAVGNGVPLCIGRALAKAVTDLEEISVTQQDNKICDCGCGRFVTGRASYYDFSCRKRAQRNRQRFVVTDQQQKGA
ncbi:DNA cytosine methyltransferase [Sulfurospirillum halorespirans]|uniref:DNA (cytosine-5-)-methyltransferase n=1 Tax=Sulfurospirillum halorespirans DSM 13726 TaxID=1193502 RepID=A0A1D7THP8_9BACT|nr:DNA cytosine methyltransferase [Sulfurospirillum halorespirans]AOO64558.1 putative DNA methyltransferase [Sulfurospirillum halorespirans DSM 13726]